MVPQVKIVPEYTLTNPSKRIGFGVFDENNKLIGVLSNEHFLQLIANENQVCDVGSILPPAIRRCSSTVECHFAKVEVAGAAPAIGFKL